MDYGKVPPPACPCIGSVLNLFFFYFVKIVTLGNCITFDILHLLDQFCQRLKLFYFGFLLSATKIRSTG
ncbi:hypothetical protein SLEP1_g43840 [Rubroshorea leprosula]|uniref:Uncharacterized protein n=1 Tax=Rubroshorea leprosula TaxID=152421 RepID=A0AAV5LEC1_9ROSI|nr:hypothetical protein SLEP1_g43840 [Rubroshorea leprosula]